MRLIVRFCLWLTYLIACLALALPVSGSPAAGSPLMVPVLVYHDLGRPSIGGNGAVVAPAEFDWQMAWLREHGYTAVTAAALADWVAGTRSLPERPVLITIDDGYASTYTEALPILKQHGMRAVLFLITDGPEGAPGNGMLTWQQVRALAGSGVFEIQGHTHAAHDQAGGVPLLLTWTDRQIQADYDTMIARFTAAGFNSPIALAYPFGRYSERALTVYRQAGVRLGFTVEHGYVRRGDDPLKLKRLIVWPGLSQCQFGALVTGEAKNCR